MRQWSPYPAPAGSVSTRSPPSQPWGESSWPCRVSSRIVWQTLSQWLSVVSLICTCPTMLWHLWRNDSGVWRQCCLQRFPLCLHGDRVFSVCAWFPWSLMTEENQHWQQCFSAVHTWLQQKYGVSQSTVPMKPLHSSSSSLQDLAFSKPALSDRWNRSRNKILKSRVLCQNALFVLLWIYELTLCWWCGDFPHCKDLGRMFDHSLPACNFLFFF